MDTDDLTSRLAAADSHPDFADTSAPDIELPFRTRAADAEGPARAAASDAARPDLVCAHLPLLSELMVAPAGPHGLEVDVKSDNRVVGTWDLDVSPKNACAVHVSQARAALHVCVSASGDPRATGAFLVLSHWWVNPGDEEQAGQLYDELTVAVLDRLGSLTERIPEHAEPMPPFVLYLIDGRTRKIKFFSLPRLAADLLAALSEDGDAAPKLRLQIAYGRGLGSSPVEPTRPAGLPPLDAPVTVERRSGVPWSPARPPRA